MNIYKISQNVNNGYDTYDSAIVAAVSEDDARNIHPSDFYELVDGKFNDAGEWADTPNQVTVELIGTAPEGTKQGVILASFNAG